MSRIRAVAALALTVAVVLTGCALPSRSDSRADEVAREIADLLTPQAPEAVDAEYLAQFALGWYPDPGNAGATVETLDWRGRVDEGEEAVITLRIAVDLPEIPSYGFGSDVEASSTVRCWDLVVRYLYDYDPGAWELRGIACPEGAAARIPDPVPLATIPDDVEPRLLGVLAVATVDDAADLTTREFPDPGFAVRVEERDGSLVIALGVPRDLGCAVGIRHPDGTAEVVQGFDRDNLQPGELGCDPMLVLGGIDTSGG